MKRSISCGTMLISSIFFTQQVVGCVQMKSEKTKDAKANGEVKALLLKAFDNLNHNSKPPYIQPTANSDLAHTKHFAYTADLTQNKQKDKTSKASVGLSQEQADFVNSVTQADAYFVKLRQYLEGYIPHLREDLVTYKTKFDGFIQQNILNNINKKQLEVLDIPPQTAITIFLAQQSNQLAKNEKEKKAIDNLKNLVQHYSNVKNLKTTKEFILQLPGYLTEILSQALDKVEEIKPLFTHKTVATIEQLQKKLNELLELYNKCEVFKYAFNLLSGSPTLPTIKIEAAVRQLEVFYKKINNEATNESALNNLLSELKKNHEEWSVHAKKLQEILMLDDKEGDLSFNIEIYFLRLVMIYTHHYQVMLAQEIAQKIKDNTNC